MDEVSPQYVQVQTIASKMEIMNSMFSVQMKAMLGAGYMFNSTVAGQ